MIQPLYIGNALKLFIVPPAGAEFWRVLRKETDDISGPDDGAAVQAYEGEDKAFIDSAFLTNDVRAYYTPFYWVNGAWVRGNGNYGTPVASYEDHSTDVLTLLRDRLEAGLAIEVQRKNILNDLGYVQVLTAPPNVKMNIAFPLVTLSLEDESPSVRGIGEDTYGDYEDDDEWLEMDGWLADVRLTITGWSLNPDERIELRKAIRRIVVGNLDVLADKGVILPNLTLSDADAVNGEFGDTPLYLVTGEFTCTAPVRVGHMASGTITDIQIGVTNG